ASWRRIAEVARAAAILRRRRAGPVSLHLSHAGALPVWVPALRAAARGPIVATLHDGARPLRWSRASRVAAGLCAAVVFPSASFARESARAGAPRSKLIVLPHGV